MIKVYVIWGPPASGKSTYVQESKGDNDVIFDFDLVMEDISGRHIYNHNDSLIGYVLDLRDSIIDRLRTEDRLDAAWLIISYPSEDMRARLEPLEPEYVLMEATREECKQRIKDDNRRVPQGEWLKAVDDWFDRYEEEYGDNDDGNEDATAQVEGVTQVSEKRMRRSALRMLEQRSRLEIRNQAGESDVAEIVLEGPVWPSNWAWDDEISPANFRKALEEVGDVKRLVIYLNSPGGDPFSGHAIHDMIRRLDAEVVIHIEGLAASAASVIAVAADRLVVAPNSTLMVHSASLGMIGWFNAQELRKEADTLDQVDKALVAAYAMKTGRNEDELWAMVKEETWLVGSEIVEEGFADELREDKRVSAFVDGDTLHANGQELDLGPFSRRPRLPEKSTEDNPAENENKAVPITIAIEGDVYDWEDFRDKVRKALERGDGSSDPLAPSSQVEPIKTDEQQREGHQPVALSYFERKLAINERMI